MRSAKILVVEDESITAKDIQETLKSQGYDVPAIALSGEEAIQKAEAIRPDLVLMDIVLKGNVDGIAAAEQIRDRFDIPVVYLTAYADSEIVKRAKITEPFGYIIKPFESRELRTNIEMALYKHKAEKALRQAEQEKAVVLGSMSELVIHQDLAHKVIWANRAAGESVGLSAKELVGRHCYEIWQGRDKPCVGCPAIKASETGRLQTAEMVTQDGRIWSVRGYPVKDVKGAVTGVVEVTENITERKKTEKKLRESEARYRNLFEQSPLGIGLATADGKVVHANKTMEVITGYFKEELKKINLADTYENPQDRKKLLETIERYGCAVDFPARLKRKDGTLFDALLNVSRVRFGDRDFFQTICMDITERKKAQEALRESETFLSATGRMAKVGGWEIDVITKEVRWTEETYHIHEVPMDYEPSLDEAINFFHPEDRPKLASAIQRALEHGEPYDMEIRFITSKGRHLLTHTTCTPRVKDGKTVKLTGTFQDITERKQAEEQIAKLAKFPAEDPNPVLRISKDCTILYANRASSVVLETWGKKVGERLPQDCCKHVEEALSSGKVSTFEFACHDGRIFGVTLAPIVESCYVNAYGLDITERKKAMEQIEKLARFPAEDPYPVIRISARGTVVYANDASLPLMKVWQCRVGESLPAEWHEIVLDALSSGDSQQTEVKYDGRTFSLVFAPVMDANYVNVYGLDITECKKAEEAVRASHDYLERLTNSMWDTVFSMKMPERVIEWVNDSYKLIGYEPEECIGRTTEFLYPDKKEYIDFGNKLQKAINAGEDVLHAEQLLRRKNGEIFPAEITTTFFRTKGKITNVTSIISDITERKRVEEKLLAYQKQLKSLASQMTLTEEQERRRIATDLHDNITQSLAMSKLKLDLMRDSKSSSSADLVEVLNETSRNIEQIIQEVRTLTFDLSSPILYELGFEAAVAEWLTERIGKGHGIATEFEDDEQPKPLDDDTRTVLFRDVRELLTNVVKHAQAKKVKVSVRKVGSRIHVSIEDDGRGFDPEKVAATAVKTGVFGLFSIRERLKQLGGNIEIESASGHGTRVTLLAPLKSKSLEEKRG